MSDVQTIEEPCAGARKIGGCASPLVGKELKDLRDSVDCLSKDITEIKVEVGKVSRAELLDLSLIHI